MAVWPNSLPAPLLAGYSVKPANNVLRTDMESGAARARPLSRSRLDKVPFSLILMGSQVETFRDFYDNEAGQGSIWFDMFINTGSQNASINRCRFISMNLIMIDRHKWRAVCEIEVRS